MRGVVLRRKRHPREHASEIQLQRERGVAGDFQRIRKLDQCEARIVGDVERPAAELAVGAVVVSLQREKHVAALPAPVEAVDERVERVAGGPLAGIAMVHLGPHAHEKLETLITSGRNAVQRETRAALIEGERSELAIQLRETSVGPHERHAGNQRRKTGEREFVGAHFHQGGRGEGHGRGACDRTPDQRDVGRVRERNGQHAAEREAAQENRGGDKGTKSGGRHAASTLNNHARGSRPHGSAISSAPE